MAVRIRMKMMGRKHRPFFRICAVDSRSPRDGSVIEEIGTYDPLVPDVDARVVLNNERLSYWLGVGAKPSVNVRTFIKKYGPEGTHVQAQAAAREKLALPKEVPAAPEPVFVPKPKPTKEELAAAAKAAKEAAAEVTVPPEAPEEPAAEEAASEE